MGQMRFRLHNRNRIAEGGLRRIYVSGSDEVPWQTRAYWDGDDLVAERSTSESGNVTVPWQVDGYGECLLTTATLMERTRPYQLEVELARGLIQRIRTRLFVWEWLGFACPEELQEKLQQATREFSLAATIQDTPSESAVAANRAITLALPTSEAMVNHVSQKAIASRQKDQPKLSTLVGTSLTPKTPDVDVLRHLVESCNIIEIPIAWRDIEADEGSRDWKQTDQQLAWCQKGGIKVAAGPLLRLDDLGVPDWMVLWEGDFDNLVQVMLDHVRAVVTRYAGRVHLWHVASRVNSSKLLSLEEEQRLYLVAQALDIVRQIDPRTPTVVSFDQPWAEYLGQKDEGLAPIHYADALVRADLGVSGFGLEINLGCRPAGTARRPIFELGRLLDQWSVWGLPLMVSLSTPSDTQEDLKARPGISIDPVGADGKASPESQLDWAASVLPLLLGRNNVQIVLWNQLTDAAPHEFPNSGLFDKQNYPKPVVRLFRDLRKSHLM